MHRFYYPNSFPKHTITFTDKNEIHHIKNVLRFKNNDTVLLFNNSGEAQCVITTITSKHIDLKIQSFTPPAKTERPYIILACAIPKKGKFETIIEKSTELGVDEIIPLKTHRTEINLDAKRMVAKNKRYETVALNAAKQSQRLSIPKIHSIKTFEELFTTLNPKTKILIPALTNNTINIFEAFKKVEKSDTIAFCIGPEGDFTPEEYKYAQEHQSIAVSLGPNILKVETAALCSLSCAHTYFT